MHKRFLKFLMGLILIYLVSLISVTNFDALFNASFHGKAKIVYESTDEVDTKTLRKIITSNLSVDENDIEFYKYNEKIEITYPYISLDDYKIVVSAIESQNFSLRLISASAFEATITPMMRLLIIILLGAIMLLGFIMLCLSFLPDANKPNPPLKKSVKLIH